MAWHNSFSQFLSNTLEHTKASFWNSVFQEALDNDNYLKESKLDTTKVVNTSDAVATDVKALNAVHANPNVEGTMAKQIANNTQQINVLNTIEEVDMLNGWQHNDGTTKCKISRVGNTVTITDFFVTGVKTDPTTIMVLPVGCKPIIAFDIGMESYTSTPFSPNTMFLVLHLTG
ncbi:hypothetical protein [Cellulosilyticum lentocellum]|uniref:Uncharacterized protein n=1 Tax=Cellulosilyticum lentocellum (strain ATCC 49066 / DSM 5427 / NCIMB 11756 / RHM5) TaxID=642492 RepID=F2JQ18_CELLD|nr:hypothetical protein [Cellulosilyticum lentocellum]ADZ82566.1 hypothetical protein Clole_0833 [Cellulosilyticum lentocellum DSM 5427]